MPDLSRSFSSREDQYAFAYLYAKLLNDKKYEPWLTITRGKGFFTVYAALRAAGLKDKHIINIFRGIIKNKPDKPIAYARRLAQILVPQWNAEEYDKASQVHKKPMPREVMTQLKDVFK